MAQTVFNPRKQPRLLRPVVPLSENISSVFMFVLLIGIVIWVMGQKDNYNPADRDIAIELLQQGSENLTLYTPPLKHWGETSAANSSAPLSIEPFPTLLLDQEWQPKSRVRQFNADNLYEKINGEAPKFLKQGFQAMYYLVLKSTFDDSELAIELYDQGDIGGSMGIFSEHQSANSEIEQHGSVMFFRTSIGIIGRKDQYFFRAAGDSDSENIQLKSAQLVTSFAQLDNTNSDSTASDSDEPIALQLIKNLFEVAPEMTSFQNQNVFQYDFAEDFWFGRISDNEGERVFAHQAESAEAAAALFQQLFEEQTYEYEVLTEESDSALFYHDFLKNYFALAHQGLFVFGIENSTDQDDAVAILQRFAEGLDLLNEE